MSQKNLASELNPVSGSTAIDLENPTARGIMARGVVEKNNARMMVLGKELSLEGKVAGAAAFERSLMSSCGTCRC